MSAPTLADRILVALANDPMSEADFRVTFPKTSLEAIRAKLVELRKGGQIVERDGVYRIAPGKSVAPESVAKVEAAAVEAREAEKRAETIGVTAAAAQRRATPARPREIPEPARVKVCIRCDRAKSIAEFSKMAKAKDGHHPWCRECTREYRKGRAKKPAESNPAKVARAAKRKPAPSSAPRAVRQVQPAPVVDAPLVAVRRTWTLSFRAVHGIVREFTLDDATRAAALKALEA